MDPIPIEQEMTQKKKTEFFLFLKVVSNIKILSTETSPMSHVTATVVGGSHSYVTGSDPKIEKNELFYSKICF